MSERSHEQKARARASAEAMDRLTRGVTLGDVTPAELLSHRRVAAADRVACLARQLPAQWVEELARPLAPYTAELDHPLAPEDP